MYTRGVGKDRIALLAYVDDLLSICSHKTMEKWKREMDKARGGHWDLQYEITVSQRYFWAVTSIVT